MATSYTVIAGTYEECDGEYVENAKFIDDADSKEAAEQMIKDKQLNSYPFCRIEEYKSTD